MTLPDDCLRFTAKLGVTINRQVLFVV